MLKNLFKRWRRQSEYRQYDLCVYEQVPTIKIATYDGQLIDEKVLKKDFQGDDQISFIEKQQRNQLEIFSMKMKMRRFNPNEYDQNKFYFDKGAAIHAGDVTDFYGKTTKMKRFFYNKRKNIV
jgi:hypothetical protein